MRKTPKVWGLAPVHTPKANGEPDAVPTDLDGNMPPVARKVEGALKALPVEPLNTGRDELLEGPPAEVLPETPRAIRAIPVKDDEVIEEGVEEP